MIEGNVEILYEDDKIIVLRISWYAGGKHGSKVITKDKGDGG